MADDNVGIGKATSDSISVPLNTYKAILRKDVEDRLWSRIKVIAGFLGLVGIAGYVSLLKLFIDPLEANVTSRVDELRGSAVRDITATVRGELASLLPQQVGQAVADAALRRNLEETIKRELGSPNSPISQAIDEATRQAIEARFGNESYRDQIDMSVLRAQVLSTDPEPQRRSFAFGQLMHLRGGPEEAHRLLILLLQSQLNERNARAVALMMDQFTSEPRARRLTDRELARRALDRAAEGFSLDAVRGLLNELPSAEAASLLRTASYANSPTMQVALELLRRDDRLDALESLATIAANASPGRASELLRLISRRSPAPADEQGMRRGPEVWHSLLQEVLSTRGPTAVLGAAELDLETLLELRAITSLSGGGLAETVFGIAANLHDRRTALLARGLSSDVLDWLREARAAAPTVVPRSPSEFTMVGGNRGNERLIHRQGADQTPRETLSSILGLDFLDEAQRANRTAMARLLPVDDGTSLPPWWERAAGLVRVDESAAGTSRESILPLVLLSDWVVRQEASSEPRALGMRLDLLRRIGRGAGLLNQPVAVRAATALLSSAPSGPLCLDGLRALAAEGAEAAVPLLVAASACRDRMPTAEMLPALNRVLRYTAALPSTESDRAGLALLVALVRDLPETGITDRWGAIVASLPPLPRAEEPNRGDIADAYAAVIVHGGEAVRRVLEASGGRGLVGLSGETGSPTEVLVARARRHPGMNWVDARWREDRDIPTQPAIAPGQAVKGGELPFRRVDGSQWVRLEALQEPLRWRIRLGGAAVEVLVVSLADVRVLTRVSDREAMPIEGQGPWLLRLTSQDQNAALQLDAVQLETELGPVPSDPFLVGGPQGRGEAAPVNQRLSHARLASENVRFVQFDFQPSERYVVRTLNLQRGVDTVVFLYNAAGEEIGQDDDGGPRLASQLRLPLGLSGPHVVGVRNIGRTGSFELTLNTLGPAPPEPPAAGPDGSGELARLDTSYGLSLDARAERAVAFDLVAGRSYLFTTSNLGSSVDTTLALADSEGRRLGEDDDGGEGLASRLVIQARASGRHVLVIRNIGSAGEFEVRGEEIPAEAVRARQLRPVGR